MNKNPSPVSIQTSLFNALCEKVANPLSQEVLTLTRITTILDQTKTTCESYVTLLDLLSMLSSVEPIMSLKITSATPSHYCLELGRPRGSPNRISEFSNIIACFEKRWAILLDATNESLKIDVCQNVAS